MSVTHGRASTYRSGCRCPECREANTVSCRARRRRRQARLVDNPKLMIPHGSYATYRNWLCRCPYCVIANAEQKRAWRRSQKQHAALES